MRWAVFLTACALAATTGCSSTAGDLRAAQALYKDARYEACQRYLEALELEVEQMSERDLARFYYMRGMTAFRLGRSDDALHYLALAATLGEEGEQRLPDSWLAILRRTLDQLTPLTATPHARAALPPP